MFVNANGQVLKILYICAKIKSIVDCNQYTQRATTLQAANIVRYHLATSLLFCVCIAMLFSDFLSVTYLLWVHTHQAMHSCLCYH